ncbi:MAG: ABC transporter ATP-binding protein [Candidatus Eremiobacterota bacterium]
MIDCRALSKFYGHHKALYNLCLKVDQGDAFGFIGPNGAGKTTTIRILATLHEPTEGEAYVGGYSVTEEPDEVRRILGYMPDHFGVYDGMRVWEYLEFFAAAYRVERNRRRKLVDDVLELTDLGKRRDSFIETLSTGLKQRVCLAKTLLHDPAVLILDEPASGLDPRARIELKELLRELTRMGKTLFVSSHILPELADFCNHVGILENGRLLVSGEVNEIQESLGRGRKMRVRVLRDAEAAAKIVEESPETLEVELEQNLIRFEFRGPLEQLAELTERLVERKVGLVEFAEEKTNLEDIFLKVTGAEGAA